MASKRLFIVDICIADGYKPIKKGNVSMKKRTMTLNLNEAEMNVLEALCAKKELSKIGLIRQALRLYQLVDVRLARGDKLFFEEDKTKDKSEVMML